MNTPLKKRANQNRTVTITDAERDLYAQRLISLSGKATVSIDNVINRTVNADLFEALAVLPAAFADLIFIDPPYNLTRDFGDLKFRSTSGDDYREYLRTWFPQVVKCLKPNGSLYICGDWRTASALQDIVEKHLTLINRITWQREKGRGAARNWKNSMEDIWFGVNDVKNYYFDIESVKQKRKVIAPYRENGQPKDWEETADGKFRLTHPSNFWDDISVPYWSMPENTDHPTQKPEKLVAKLILASCPPNGIVFDPFLGSGTTSVAAKKLGRRYLGVEMNREYCLWAEKRLAMAESDKTIQGYTDGVFWERNTMALQKNVNNKKKKKPNA